MKLRILVILAVLSAGIAASRANITSATITNADSVMSCYLYPLQQISPGNYQLDIAGQQYDFASGTLRGDINTDTPTDPALNLVHTINNDTGTIWSDYHVVVTMSQSFTFSSVLVTNAGWTFNPVLPPAPSGPNWVGSIDFFAGGPSTFINPGDILGFSFTINFAGSVAFSETLTPSVTNVPEPSAIALLACGLMGLFVIQRRLTA